MREVQSSDSHVCSFLQRLSRKRQEKVGEPSKKISGLRSFPLRQWDLFMQDPGVFALCNMGVDDVLLEPDAPYFLFRNGIWDREASSIRELSPKVVVLSLEHALNSSYRSFLQHRMTVVTEEENDPFVLLNGASCSNGLFIYVPPGEKVLLPLQFLFMQTDDSAFCVFSRVHIFVGADAEVQILSSVEGGGVYNGYMDLVLEERSFVSYVSYPGHVEKKFCFSAMRASLKKESYLQGFFFPDGEVAHRESCRIALQGERGQVELYGLGVLSGTRQSHADLFVEHKAPFCRSQQLWKNALFDRSKAQFCGEIYVHPIAQKTEAYQMSRSLLLSDHASATTKPNLEIFADDVKASHGATISQLDEDQKLYLRSRGIAVDQATALLLRGFCQEIWDKLPRISLVHRCQMQYRKWVSL